MDSGKVRGSSVVSKSLSLSSQDNVGPNLMRKGQGRGKSVIHANLAETLRLKQVSDIVGSWS